MSWLLLIPFLIVSIFLFLFLYEYWKASQIVNVKTGASLPYQSIVSLIINLLRTASFAGATPLFQLQDKILKYYNGGPYGSWFPMSMQFQVNFGKPEIVKWIFSDSQTFGKNFIRMKRIPKMSEVFLIDESVVNVEGEKWKRQRQSIDPAFFDLSIYSESFSELSKKAIEQLKTAKEVNNVHEMTQKLTLDILSKCIFNVDFDSLDGNNKDDLQAYNTVMNLFFQPLQMLKMMLLNTINPFYNVPPQFAAGVDHLKSMVSKLIDLSKKKIENGEKLTSMLDYMVASHVCDKQISLDELRSNVFIFFLAGHETTATSLAFLIQVLAMHPEIQEKMRKEVYEKIGKDTEPTSENVRQLDYMAVALKENLRMYGPVTQLQRVTLKDVVVDDWLIPKGTRVQVNMNAAHMNKEVYGDPEVFRPERWLDGAEGLKLMNQAWVPFGGGSRICVGNNFSLLEQKIFMTLLLQKTSWKMLNPNDKEIEFGSTFLRQPKEKTVIFSSL